LKKDSTQRVCDMALGFRLTASVLAIAFAAPAFAQAVEPAAPTTTAPQPGEDASPASGPANAQDIVVTGSRIARRDYEANSPIVTVGDALLEQSSTASLESSLNKLPQFSPANARTPTTSGGDIQPTARNTPGATAVSLRGIGTNRTLVLINGRRATPADATGTVDINTIPTAAVERVEIISGGASSTYGADAVSGVTNFILKTRFTGLELDAQTSITERGDNFEYQVAGVMGTNFADDRGNISIAFSANERKRGYNRNRPWFKDLWANPNIGGSGFIPGIPGVNLNVALANPANPAVLNALIPGANPALPGQGITVYVNPDGSIFTGFDRAGRGGRGDARIIDGYRNKALNNGQIGVNFTDALTVSPLTRYNAFAQGNYEINDSVEAFFQSNFSNTTTASVQEPAPIVGGWSANVNYNSAAPQAGIPQELRQVLNSRANPNAPFQITQLLPFNRTSAGEVYSYNMTAGLRGNLPVKDWKYEIFGSQGKTQSTVTQGGFGSLQRYRTIINFGNLGQGFRATGNAEGGGFGASTATCTSGLNPFSGAPVSADCLEAIKADIKTQSVMHQTVWEGDVTGTLFDLPAGPLQSAIGASYRSNNYRFSNDTLTTQGRSFLEQSVGLYPAGNSSGKINVSEFYGELLIPVLKDIPAIQELSLELGGRLSDYNTTGNSYTYKILGDWKVTDWLRFRGGYNRAERAPNVAELYLAPEQTFGSAPGGDVCSRLNQQAWSANPARNPNAARVEALCRVLMLRSGDASAPTQYYDLNPQPVGSTTLFPTLNGNANLRPEKADTYTAGVVLSSPFETPFLKRLRLTVDYYNIRVNDAIGPQSVDIAQRQCFDTAFNPTLSADSAFCNGVVNRNNGGGLGNVITTFQNSGRFRTSGIDAQLDWTVPIGPGQLNLNTVVNYLLYTKSSELTVLPLVDYTGTLGTTQNGLNGGAYKWRLFSTLGYSIGGASLSLQWRHLPAIDQEAQAINPLNSISGYPKYDLFNLLGSLAVNSDVSVRFGVENLFDKAPPLGGVNTTANLSLGQLPGGSYNALFYDIIGRRFYLGMKAKF
jgi:iron complex outermembrane receptor protein